MSTTCALKTYQVFYFCTLSHSPLEHSHQRNSIGQSQANRASIQLYSNRKAALITGLNQEGRSEVPLSSSSIGFPSVSKNHPYGL